MRRNASVLLAGVAAMVTSVSLYGAVVNVINPEQSQFEAGTTVNNSPRTGQGANPVGYYAGGEVADPLVDASVVAEGSPFDGGSSNSLLLYDTNAGGSRLQVMSNPAIAQGGANSGGQVYFSFDFRFNDIPDAIAIDADRLVFRPSFHNLTPDGSAFVLIDAGNGQLKTDGGAGAPLYTGVERGAWYRLEGTLETSTHGSLKLTKWVSESQQELVYSGTNIPLWSGNASMPSDGVSGVSFYTSFGGQGVMDVNLDNLVIGYVPEPASLGLLALPGALILARRSR